MKNNVKATKANYLYRIINMHLKDVDGVMSRYDGNNKKVCTYYSRIMNVISELKEHYDYADTIDDINLYFIDNVVFGELNTLVINLHIEANDNAYYSEL